MLAPYAISESNSKGRLIPIAPAVDRNDFQRDYTRISHSQAFRRLQGKTQVFSNNEQFNESWGDMYRTRLTHSLEVEQLSRSVARRLNLNEDLAGVLAIGHDIGHAPFGHLGQDTLNELMKPFGGFEHNYQALRLVDKIEKPYQEHVGLNLMFETREGLLKHCSKKRAVSLGEVAARHLNNTSPTLEAQVVDWCDAIAYLHADLEDAFSIGILSPSKLLEAPGYEKAFELLKEKTSKPFNRLYYPSDNVIDIRKHDAQKVQEAKTLIKSIIRQMFTTAASELVEDSFKRIQEKSPQNIEDVRRLSPLVGLDKTHAIQHFELKSFSSEYIYNDPQVLKIREGEKEKLKFLFAQYQEDPTRMLGRGPQPEEDIHRAIADHIAGMTDRYAERECQRLGFSNPNYLNRKMKM